MKRERFTVLFQSLYLKNLTEKKEKEEYSKGKEEKVKSKEVLERRNKESKIS